jgi:hypothetical protein
MAIARERCLEMVEMGIDIRRQQAISFTDCWSGSTEGTRQAELKQDRSSPVFISSHALRFLSLAACHHNHTTLCQKNILISRPQRFCNSTSTLASTQPISASFHHDVTHLCAATIGPASNTRPGNAFPTHRELSAFHVSFSLLYFLCRVRLSPGVICFLSAACWMPLPPRWLTPPRMWPS